MEAEDLMQETFLSAFTHIGNYRGDSSIGTWLKRIAINKSLNHLKKNTPDFSDFPEDNLPLTDETEETTNRFTLEQIIEAINRLPEGYRVVINLYLREGMDHDEIAGILNIKPATSRSQYLRAKKKLAEILMNRYYERQA